MRLNADKLRHGANSRRGVADAPSASGASLWCYAAARLTTVHGAVKRSYVPSYTAPKNAAKVLNIKVEADREVQLAYIIVDERGLLE